MPQPEPGQARHVLLFVGEAAIQKGMFYLLTKNVVGENEMGFQFYFNLCSVSIGRP